LVNKPTVEIPSVDWWITSQCNLSCDFCYGPDPEEKGPVGLRAGILRALEESSARVVTFCGGEPLLVKEISEYAATLGQHGKSAVLNTNGERLRKRLYDTRPGWEFRLADFAMVGFSVDGSTPEIHQRMRGEKADLGEVMEAVRLVKREPGVKLKLATVVSAVNRDNLTTLAETVRNLAPDIWRLYQYSSRGEVNTGQDRHRLADDEFLRLAEDAAKVVKPVPTAPSSEVETEGCLIVDPVGYVLQPMGGTYIRYGNCLEKELNSIWAKIPAQSTIIDNKRWLEILG
jgi:MoaA/NifB/PqqE/SkfB family radical SAM enzyme